jgi:hypothetical protein
MGCVLEELLSIKGGVSTSSLESILHLNDVEVILGDDPNENFQGQVKSRRLWNKFH